MDPALVLNCIKQGDKFMLKKIILFSFLIINYVNASDNPSLDNLSVDEFLKLSWFELRILNIQSKLDTIDRSNRLSEEEKKLAETLRATLGEMLKAAKCLKKDAQDPVH